MKRHWGLAVAALIAVALLGAWAILRGRAGAKAPVTLIATWTAPGSSASAVETEVEVPAEAAVLGIPGIAHVEARSTDGMATLRLTLIPKGDDEATLASVRAALGSLRSLPASVDPVVVRRESSGKTLRFLVTEDTLASPHVGRDVIAPLLQGIAGVGGVSVCGERESSVEIVLDSARLAALRLGADAVATTIRHELPPVKTVAEVGTIVLSSAPSIALRDVARISEESRSGPCVAFTAAGPRTLVEVAIADDHAIEPVRRAITTLSLPAGVTVTAFDSTIVADVVARGGAPPGAGSRLARSLGAIAAASDAVVVSGEEPGADFVVHVALRSGTDVEPARDALSETLQATPGIVAATRLEGELPWVFRVRGLDLEVGTKAANDVSAAVAKNGDVRGAIVLDARTTPRVTIEPDLDRASRFGITGSRVATFVELAMTGQRVGTLHGYPVVVRVDAPSIDHGELSSVIIPTPGAAIPLSQLATARNALAPVELVRWDAQRAVRVAVDRRPRLSEAALLALVRAAPIPASVTITNP
ncbi:hypothetical protein BH09MYX1_BH09MYX1_25950 [soil metagenome]